MAITNSKIKAIPQLPRLEGQAVLDWLTGLRKYSSKDACLHILFLLQTIDSTNARIKNKSTILESIQDYLTRYISTLKVTCWDASIPLTAKEMDYAEIITWNYLILSHCFFSTAKEMSSKYFFSSVDKNISEAFALYKALQALGQAQLHTSAIYCIPHDGFWRFLYQIFTHAEKRKLLDLAINKNELSNVTINGMFKQILIFDTCDTYQFRPRDMRTIFNLLADVCHVVNIYKNPDKDPQLLAKFLANPSNISDNKNDLFAIQLDSDNPPFSIKKKTTLHSSNLRYFSPVGVAQAINDVIERDDKWSGIAKNINNALFKRVTKTLSQRQKRKSERVSNNEKVLGVIGFENIVHFLRKELPDPIIFLNSNEEDEELEIFAGDHNLWNMTGRPDDLNLAFQFAVEDKNSKWNDSKQVEYRKENAPLKEITIFESSVKGYSVFWHDDGEVKAKIDDIFGLILGNTKKRLEIALIRRITLSSANSFRFGAEVIGFESEAVYISHPKNKNKGCWAILILGARELKQPDTLIYPVIHFRIGDRICLHKENKEFSYLIARELYTTSSIAHVEIDYLGNYESNLTA